jgi:hypothetical protein
MGASHNLCIHQLMRSSSAFSVPRMHSRLSPGVPSKHFSSSGPHLSHEQCKDLCHGLAREVFGGTLVGTRHFIQRKIRLDPRSSSQIAFRSCVAFVARVNCDNSVCLTCFCLFVPTSVAVFCVKLC